MRPVLIASPVKTGVNSTTYFPIHRMNVIIVPHMGPGPPERKPVRRAGIDGGAGRLPPEDE